VAGQRVRVMRPVRYPRLTVADFARLLARVVVIRHGRWVCWELEGKRDRYGYSRFWLGGQWRQAHRVAYEWLVAEAPEPVMRQRRRTIPGDRPQLDHLCDNEACVRPTHLRPATQVENQTARVIRNPRYKTVGGVPKSRLSKRQAA
jgi:hypothetical protein